MATRTFRVTIEQPRELRTVRDTEVSVSTYVTYVYGCSRQSEVREVLTLPQKLKELRRQGLRITKPQMERADLLIERI